MTVHSTNEDWSWKISPSLCWTFRNWFVLYFNFLSYSRQCTWHGHRNLQWAMSKDEPLLSNCPLETAEPSRNYARVPGYKKKYKKNTRKRREKTRKMKGVEIHTRAYVATRLLLRWDYLYAVTLKTKVFGDNNHARLEVSWINIPLIPQAGLLPRGDYFYAVTPVWIGVRMTWKSYPSRWDTPFSASLWPCARTSEREAEKYTFYYHASHFISHILFFKKAQWSDVIVCHEFCVNAYDHVFRKVFGKM